MEDQIVIQILELLQTLQEACPEVYHSAETKQGELFERLCGDIRTGLDCILALSLKEEGEEYQKLSLIVQSAQDSFSRMRALYLRQPERCLRKIEFECLPLLQEAYATFYHYRYYLVDHPEELSKFYTEACGPLYGNAYIDEAMETNHYRYEVSIVVTAYNKLEYTKRCLESLLKNIPEGLNHELILVNHGSSDGTKEYFEGLHPDKQLDIAVNGGGVSAIGRIVEGEFVIWISNDLIITPHAIENLLACMRSDPRIMWAVPSTSNVSNLQSIPAVYSTEEELMEFCRENNRQDPYRWEQRVRLCNPLDIRRSSMWYGTGGLGLFSKGIYPLRLGSRTSFPDDRAALLIRRSGNKIMLVKDAYCHHFGSVTWKPIIRQQGEQDYYMEGRRDFAQMFGVDPWGTGFCFDPAFTERVVAENQGHTEVLGVNCGLGSNSLKIREQIREYCHNPDVSLTNITSDPGVLEDLAAVSDRARKIDSLKKLGQFLAGNHFDYIVWDDPFPAAISEQKVLDLLLDTLAPAGQLLTKRKLPADAVRTEWKGGWFRYARKGT